WTTITQPPFNFAPMYLFAALVIFSVIVRFRQYRLWEVAYLAVLTLLGNFATRGAMDWFLNMLALGTPHLCILWRQALENPRRFGVRQGLKPDNRVKRMFQTALFRPQWAWPAAGFIVLFVVSIIPPLSRIMPRQNSDEWPVAALDYLEATGRGGNFFGPPDYSAYV